MKHRTLSQTVRRSLLFGFAVVLGVFTVAPPIAQVVQAAPQITISSPTNGQTFTGNDFTISGTTDANATVLLQKNDQVLKQIRSDGSGNWSTQLTGLPDGNNTITVKVVKNKGEAFFVSTADFSNFKLNQLRLSDHAINPAGGWPINLSSPAIGLVPSPSQNIFYSFASALSSSAVPAKFSADSPAVPVAVSGYPANPSASKGDFTADGTKYYSPNIAASSVSVVNVATNSLIKNISVGSQEPIRIDRHPGNGKMYVAGTTFFIINPADDNVISVPDVCSDGSVASVSFSSDPTYAYYFAHCNADGVIQKMRLSDNAVVADFAVGDNPDNSILSADSSKLFAYTSALQPGTTNPDIMKVVSTETGEILESIQLTDGAVGILSTPDYQKLYVPTPGADLQTQNIDVVDMTTYAVEQIPLTDEIAAVVTASPLATADIADVNVGVVLGVKNAAAAGNSGTLANTGALAVSATLLGGIIIASLLYTYIDYRRHKRPLTQADPEAHKSYTYLHHVRTVSVPLLKYRLRFSLQAVPSGSDSIKRF